MSIRRKEIIEILSQAFYELKSKKLLFTEINDKSLKQYVTNQKEKKKNPNYTRMDTSQSQEIDAYLEQFKVTKMNGSKQQTNDEIMVNNHNIIKSVKLEDFKVLKVIGRGSFGKVCLVEHIFTKEIYAMKGLKKDLLIEQEQINNTILEKEILQSINHPFLCGLIFGFQTEERIFFVMPFLSGGELFQHLRKARRFDEEKTRFYGAQIALAIDYLHQNGILYRDLKPENVLLDELGYLKLADFGMAKKLKKNEKATSFCGTPEYLAPEIIVGEGYDKAADWWSFGILLYEMLCGIPPFYLDNMEKMYEMIKSGPLRFPKRITLSQDAQDVIKKVCNFY